LCWAQRHHISFLAQISQGRLGLFSTVGNLFLIFPSLVMGRQEEQSRDTAVQRPNNQCVTSIYFLATNLISMSLTRLRGSNIPHGGTMHVRMFSQSPVPSACWQNPRRPIPFILRRNSAYVHCESLRKR
jgi:hypothetical protein